MTADEHWDFTYDRIMTFMDVNKHRPSRRKREENSFFNWIKFNKRQLSRDKMPQHRREKFRKLLTLAESLRRINQYAYLKPIEPSDSSNS